LEHFGARTSYKQTRTHKTHHNPDLGKAYSILYAWPRDQHPNVILSQDSLMGVSKFSQLGFSQLWGPIILHADLWLRWGLKKICSPCWEFSNGMSHATFMQENRGDPRLLVVGSQIANLTFDPSFGHNLCLKYSNESCEPILNIYVSRNFQWYK
jgi:hypothetical protein